MDYRGIEPRTSRSFTEMRSERTTPVLTAQWLWISCPFDFMTDLSYCNLGTNV